MILSYLILLSLTVQYFVWQRQKRKEKKFLKSSTTTISTIKLIAIISRKERGWDHDSEWNQFQIRSELFPILQSGRSVKESDNFTGYDFTRSKERACLGGTRIEGGKYCSMHSARRQDTHGARERERERIHPTWLVSGVGQRLCISVRIYYFAA